MSEIITMKAPGEGAISWNGTTKHYLVEHTLDFSDTGALTTDTVQVFDVKAKQLLLSMLVEVVTPEGGTATIDIGLTGGDVDRFIDGANINGAAGTVQKSGDAGTKEVIVAEGGYYFAAADAIDLLPLNDLDTAVIKVFARFVDMS